MENLILMYHSILMGDSIGNKMLRPGTHLCPPAPSLVALMDFYSF